MAAMGSLDAYDFGLEAGVETFPFGGLSKTPSGGHLVGPFKNLCL